MKSRTIALFCLIFLFCGSVPILENTQSNSIQPAEVVTTKTLSGDNKTGFSDHFTTDSTGYNPDLWSLESYDAEGNVTWENETLLGLTSWGHGYRTIVSNWSTGPNFVADFRTKFCDSNSLPAVGWMDVIPDEWNYNPTGGQNGVWIEFNWPIARQVSFYTKKDGVENYVSINVGTYYDYHDYRLLWTNDSAALFIDGTMRANSSINIPDVNLPFKALVTSWSGDAQGQWMHLDYVNVSPVKWTDNFDDGNYDGWTVELGGWSTADGVMRGTASDWNSAHHNSTMAIGRWSFDAYHMGAGHIEIWFICNTLAPSFNMATDGYQVALDQTRGSFELWKRVGYEPDIQTKIDNYTIPGGPGGWWHIDVTRDSEGLIRAYLNGTLRLEAVDTLFNTSSYFCLNTFNKHAIDNIVVFNSTESIELTDLEGPSIEHSRIPSLPTQNEQIVVAANITDASGVSNAILSFTNDSEVQWYNISMTLSNGNWTATIPEHAVGVGVQYKVYANDTVGNWAVSSTSSYIVADGEEPIISFSHSPIEPIQSDVVIVSANVTDYSTISQVILSYNIDSGVWHNSSMVLASGNWTASIPAQESGAHVSFKIYAEDSEGNWAISMPKDYTVLDGAPPTFEVTHTPTNPTSIQNVEVIANVSDSSAITTVILSYRIDGGIWHNSSMSYNEGSWTGMLLMQSNGTQVDYKIYAEDDAGNWGVSIMYSYTVSDITTETTDTTTTSVPPEEEGNLWTFLLENPVILAALIAGSLGIISAVMKLWSDRKNRQSLKTHGTRI